jgi:hypothetical protein
VCGVNGLEIEYAGWRCRPGPPASGMKGAIIMNGLVRRRIGGWELLLLLNFKSGSVEKNNN